MTKHKESLGFQLPASLETALQAAQAALEARDGERAAAERARIVVSEAKRSLADAVQIEEAAEIALANGATDAPALKRAADQARAARESAAVEVDRAERRAKILADNLQRDDQRISDAAAGLDRAIAAMYSDVGADYRARLAVAATQLLTLLAEGKAITAAFPRIDHLARIISGFSIPDPSLSSAAFSNVGWQLTFLANEGRIFHEAPIDARVEKMASALETVHQANGDLQSVLREESRRRAAENARREGQREPAGVRITYADENPMISNGPAWSPDVRTSFR